MTILRLALLQLDAPGAGLPPDLEANRQAGEVACRQAKAQGADLALFPEMWSHGYRLPTPGDPAELERWRASALPPEHPFLAHFQALAAELELAIALTYLQESPGLPRNALTLYDRQGTAVLDYAKVHTCDFDREAALTPGAGFVTAPLDTAGGRLQVGAMICFDREFPESARSLMLQGAELILVPNACEMEINRLAQLRTRSFENMLGIALANYPSCGGGGSLIFDGIAFSPDEDSRDMTLVQAGAEAGIYLADMDMQALRHYRQHEVWGDAYRKPSAYAPVDTPVQAPFIRPDSRRAPPLDLSPGENSHLV